MTEPKLTPQEQSELDAINADVEPWMREDYPIDEDLMAQAALALDDPLSYAELSMAFEGEKVQPHGIHVLMADVIACAKQSKQHVLIVVPPEHGKTSLALKLVVHYLGQNPRLRFAMVSASEKTAKKNLTHTRKTLMSPLTKVLWPAIVPDIKRSASSGGWSQEALYFEGNMDPAVRAYSLMADSQGMRFDMILFDDIVTTECQTSEAKREEVHRYFHGQWLNRITDDGLCIILNNCQHREDSVHKALESESFLTLWIEYDGTDRIVWRVHHAPPCWINAESGTLPLWERWPKERLERKLKSDPPTYKRYFEQRATVADEMRLPDPSSWATYKLEELPGPETGARMVAYLDPAGGKNVSKGDFAALVLGVIARDSRVFIIDFWVKRAPPEQQIMALWTAHQKVGKAGWEGIHAARFETLSKDEIWMNMAIDQFKSKIAITNPSFKWIKNFGPDYPDTTASKESRIERLHGPLGNGDILFPEGFRDIVRGVGDRAQSWGRLISQIEDFPHGSHDDAPDALEGLYRLAKSIGPGLATYGSGIVGPREIQRELADARETANVRMELDRRTMTFKAVPVRRGRGGFFGR